ncbi:MAG: hypothetical protein ABIS67_13340 [Candidatus Eisenbacteria bacterium]
MAGVIGPRICFSSDIVDYCYAEGGYCVCESAIVSVEIPAGRVLTMNWNADPQPGASIRWYSWAVDIEDVTDQTPRVDEATDLAHWSVRSATPVSVQLGPWNAGDVHTFYLDVSDDQGFRSLGMVRFTVVPATNRAPVCGTAVPDRTVLWPPDHRLVPVSIQGVSDPDGDPVTIRVTRVTQDEPPGDSPSDASGLAMDAEFDADASAWAIAGNSTDDAGGLLGDHREGRRTCPDAEISLDGQVMLRAERSAAGDGRVYTIRFTASDPTGASCEGTVRVSVPQDQRQRESGDGGQNFNSLGPCEKGERARQPIDQ